MNNEDILAGVIAVFDLVTYCVMGYFDIGIPMMWVIGILYPSIAWYFLLRWFLRTRQFKKTGHI